MSAEKEREVSGMKKVAKGWTGEKGNFHFSLTIVSQKRNIFPRGLAVLEIVDGRTVRVDGASLHQQVLSNLVRC